MSVTVTATYLAPDGTAAMGRVHFDAVLSNGNFAPSVTATLAVDGSISMTLAVGTYRVVERVGVTSRLPFTIILSASINNGSYALTPATPAFVPTTTLITAIGAGSYTVPTGATVLLIEAVAGGGGAGSGRRGAAGSVRCAGGPGANGQIVRRRISVTDIIAMFPSGVIPYSVGAGCAGGAAVTVNDTNGNAGAGATTVANATVLGNTPADSRCVVFARAGGAGSGGTATTGAAGAISSGTVTQNSLNGASTTGGAGGGQNPCGAGVGGGITSADIPGAGASAGTGWVGCVPGSGGSVDAALPASGTPPFSGVSPWSTAPGGGAASITTAAQAGASGAANSGSGGASGGASLNGNNSGAGGAGGSGYLYITAL